MGMMGSVFLIPIFAQTFLGYDATKAGYLFIPMAAALMLAAPIGGSLIGQGQARLRYCRQHLCRRRSAYLCFP